MPLMAERFKLPDDSRILYFVAGLTLAMVWVALALGLLVSDVRMHDRTGRLVVLGALVAIFLGSAACFAAGKRRLTLRQILLAIAAAGLALGVFRGWWLHIGQPFDAAKWRGDVELDALSSDRRLMAERLLARDTLIGLSDEKIAEMLGEPDEDRIAGDDAGHDVIYYIGNSRFGFDSELLVLRSKAGKVTAATIHEDW
jgi:hypothetical protein